MTIPKPPTPQGVSALLKRAGFERADRPVRGGMCSGFRVSTVYAREGAVRVKHLFWSMRATPEQHAAKLAPYAKAIAEAGRPRMRRAC